VLVFRGGRKGKFEKKKKKKRKEKGKNTTKENPYFAEE
jgi:hypothetical protein